MLAAQHGQEAAVGCIEDGSPGLLQLRQGGGGPIAGQLQGGQRVDAGPARLGIQLVVVEFDVLGSIQDGARPVARSRAPSGRCCLGNGEDSSARGSHRAGRRPAEQDKPTFCGTGPISLFARAGDAYMFNNQIWHRGAPNASNRTRFMAGVTYSKRFISQRFYPFIDYRMPPHVMEGASPRLQRLLGRHEKGAYG